MAGRDQWLPAGVLRHRHLPLAGHPALSRLGPAGLLQPVPAAAAFDADHLAGDRRAGAAGRAHAAPAAPRAAAFGVRVVAGAAVRRAEPRQRAAVAGLAAHTRSVRRPADADTGPA